MRSFKLFLNVCLFVYLAATPAFAQYTLNKIVFDGAPTLYSHEALETASGLKPGDKLTQETMQAAAQRLSDTGAFGDIQVTLDGPLKAVTIIFKITPLDPSHELSVSFDNFVWFTPTELEEGLRSRIPLFTSQLPEAGNLQNAVQAALSDMLQKKGVTATVTYAVFDPTVEHPSRIVAYRVATPSIHIHTVHLTGVSPEFVSAINDLGRKVDGTSFNDGFERVTTEKTLLAPYYKAGYLKAQLSNRTLALTNQPSGGVDVDLSAAIDAGAPYRIANIVWTGSPEMSTAAFAAACPLHAGDLASTSALAKCVDLLAIPYRKKGYADIIVSPVQAIDTDAHSVSYTFNAAPGEVYKIRTLMPVNLTPAQQADFTRGWALKIGDVFDSEYITNFLTQNSALHSFNGYSASYKATRDSDLHLVDVIVTFHRALATELH